MISISTVDIAVSMEPQRGGKIASIRHRSTGREWLESSSSPLEGALEDDQSFDDGDMCGWDEMMPTIEECRYPDSDIWLGDHGELWRQAWAVTSSDATSITTLVRDEVLGYRVERRLRVVGAGLSVEYRVTSEVDVDRSILWAAHPLFAHRRGTRIILNGLENMGPPTSWPEGTWTDDGWSLDQFAAGQSQKLFARLTTADASVTLVDPDGARLRMRWNRNDAPYLGIWLDNCSLSRHPVIALEPTNAPCDALDVAVEAARPDSPWTLRSREHRVWRVDLELSETAVTSLNGSHHHKE